jgi:hypothetical protein
VTDKWEDRAALRAKAEKADKLAPGQTFVPVQARMLVDMIDSQTAAADAVAKLREERNTLRSDARLLALALKATADRLGLEFLDDMKTIVDRNSQ